MFQPINTNFSKNFGSNRWSSYSIKIQRNVYLASNLEYDNWLYVECNPNIINFCEQPFEIKQVVNGQICSSIPDMWLLYADGTEEVREVKYDKDLMEERVQKQIKIQQEYCKEKGIVHRIITDKHLRSNTYLLSNYKLIIQMLKQQINYDKQNEDLLLNLITSHPVSIQDVFRKTAIPINRLIPHLAYLLYKGVILADLDNNFLGNKLEVYKSND